MWKTKDPNPFHYPPLWLKLKCSKKCHFKLKQNLSLCLPHLLCLFLSLSLFFFFFVRETQGLLRDVFLIQEFLGGHISKPAELTGCWLEVCPVWRLYCRALQKNLEYFYRINYLCIYITVLFHISCFDPPFPRDTRADLLQEGEKKKEDVWAPPGALPYSGGLKRIVRKHVYTSRRQKKLSGLFL